MTPALEKPDFPPASRSHPVAGVERLASLFEEHAGFVARSLRRLGVPERDVEDGLQEVFLIAQSKLDAIEPGKERSFLFGIAQRHAASPRRSFDRASRSDEQVDVSPGWDATPDSAERTEQAHARATLDEVLEELPEDLRTVLVLYELEEMEMGEIAELLGIPTGVVASRLGRAREKFEASADRIHERVASGEGR